MKFSITILFLYNICPKKEGFHFLNVDVYFVLLFQSYGRHTPYMQPYLFPKKVYFYFIFFCVISEFFNQLIHNLVKVHRKLCTYRHQHICFRKTILILNMLLKGFHSDILLSFFHYFSKGTLHSCLFENAFAFMSNKCCTPLCKGTEQNDITSWKDLVSC